MFKPSLRESGVAASQHTVLMYARLLKMFWKKKAAYVEWALTGDAADGFGAVIYLSAAPMITVHEITLGNPTQDDVAQAVQHWVSSVPQQYRLNQEFERFKQTARELDEADESGQRDGPFGPLVG